LLQELCAADIMVLY